VRTPAERIRQAKEVLRDALFEQHGKAKEPDAQKVKEAIEAYVASGPERAEERASLDRLLRSGRIGLGTYTKEHADAARRLHKALEQVIAARRDKNLPRNLQHPLGREAAHKLDLTDQEYEQLDYILEDWQRRARAGSKPWKRWPKGPTAREKAAAAEAAVQLFDHHKLVCTASKSANNRLLKLAAVIYGEPLHTGKRDAGWHHYCNDAINAALATKKGLRHTQRTTITTPLK
jgi:hypothetical protein